MEKYDESSIKILEGLDAIIAQHEYDHLDGITMINRAIYKTFKRR